MSSTTSAPSAQRLLVHVGVLAVLTGIAGCGALGSRATSGCPAGETCNAAAPNGLRFFGASLAGTLTSAPSTVAIDGHESIRFEDASAIPQPIPTQSVVSSDPTHVAVTMQSTNTAALTGVGAGSALIRVLADRGELLDRIGVGAARVDRVEAIATEDLLIALAPAPAVPVAFAPGTQRIGLALRDAAGNRLVDDQMRVTSATTFTSRAWDTVEVTFGTTDVTFTAAIGTSGFDVTAHAAGPIDDFELAAWLLPADASNDPLVGAGDAVCFIPRSRGARVVGGTDTLTFRVDGHDTPADSTRVCVALPSGLGTSVVVDVSLGTATRSFTLAVDPGRTTHAMALVTTDLRLPRVLQVELGERARLVWSGGTL